MSGEADPWDAMVQNDDSDGDYIPTGADGIDDEDQDFEQQDDYAYEGIDEGDTSDEDELRDIVDIVLSPCTLRLSCVTSAEYGTGCFTQAPSQMLQLWLRCRN